MRPLRYSFAALTLAAALATFAPVAVADEPSPAAAPLAALPAPQIEFPNAQPAPVVDAPVAAPPPRSAKVPLEAPRLSLGPGVVAGALGAMPLLDLVGEVSVGRGFGLRGWFDVPLGSRSVVENGGTSAVSVWMGGVGFERTFGDRTDRARLRLHAGWGASVLHARAASSDGGSGLTLTKRSQDLFTLLGQVGLEVGTRVVGPVSVVGGARAGTLLSRLVVEHRPGDEAGVFGPPFAALDLRVEVQP